MAIRLTTASFASAAALLLGPLASHASPLLFTLTDTAKPQVVTFELDSNPTPISALSGSFSVAVADAQLDGVADPALTGMSFATSVNLGGLSSLDGTIAAFGDQIFGGGTSAAGQPAPFFTPSTFNLFDATTNDDETLTVSALSAAPEPSTWALMIAGIGMMGLALRFRRPKGAVV